MTEPHMVISDLRRRVLAGEDVSAYEYREALDIIEGMRTIPELTLRERLEIYWNDRRIWTNCREEKMIKWIVLSTIILWLFYLADLLNKG